MNLENMALGGIERACFDQAYKHGRYGRASGKLADRGTKVHQCDVSMRVDILKGTLLAERHSPQGERLAGDTIDLFLGYE